VPVTRREPSAAPGQWRKRPGPAAVPKGEAFSLSPFKSFGWLVASRAPGICSWRPHGGDPTLRGRLPGVCACGQLSRRTSGWLAVSRRLPPAGFSRGSPTNITSAAAPAAVCATVVALIGSSSHVFFPAGLPELTACRKTFSPRPGTAKGHRSEALVRGGHHAVVGAGGERRSDRPPPAKRRHTRTRIPATAAVAGPAWAPGPTKTPRPLPSVY
jgi:hypothetical protein